MLGCQAFGLLLAWFGLCLTSLSDKVTMAGLSIPTTVPIRRVHDLLDHVLDLRTIIVIADIYRGLYNPAQQINSLHPPYLTFRHRSGVTLYTSTFVLAESCVFDKQSAGKLSLRPTDTRRYVGRPYPEVTVAFLPSSLRTSHSFALVFSTLPPVSVCGTEPLCLTQTKFFSEACSLLSDQP